MEVKRVLRMADGTGDTSYACNSSLQKIGSLLLKHLVDETILDLCDSEGFIDDTTSIADLGCSSGPNTLWIVSEIINIIDRRRRLLGRKSSPQYLIYLNDLESNDFNTVFNTFLPPFYEKLKRENGEEFVHCFVAAIPGSFYGRLFPNKSLHFVHSSYSVHWLSRVPTGLEDEMGNPINKGNAYLGKTSPPEAFEAYLKQFQEDFLHFLKLRAEEIVGGGKMVLICLGRRSGRTDDTWMPLTIALQNTASQGLIQESEVDMFNLPIYHPSTEELTEVIAKEGSFHLNKLDSHELEFEFNGKDGEGCETDKAKSEMLMKSAGAIVGPTLVSHFGEDATDKILGNLKDVSLKCWKDDGKSLLHVAVSLTRKKHDAHVL